MKRCVRLTVLTCLLSMGGVMAEPVHVELPELLVSENGQRITTADEWTQIRRPELLEWYRENMYGRMPVGRPPEMRFRVFEQDDGALNGAATRKQVRIDFTDGDDGPYMNLLIYIPNDREGPAPVYLGTNGRGNHTITDDEAVVDTGKRSRGQPHTLLRGAGPWPIADIVGRGYALAAFHSSDVAPDFPNGHLEGVQAVFDPVHHPDGRPGDAWGTLAVWAWGLSRAMDYIEIDPDLDAGRVAVTGQSRRGKAALWAGIEDERFALVVGNNSVGQGSSLMRVPGGNDTIGHLLNYAPYWFCENWKQYDGMDAEMPVDQHMFLALVAPRRVYVASAEEDRWGYPIRCFLASLHASPAWELFGLEGLTVETMPEVDVPVHDGHVGFHIRSGPHSHSREDWLWQLDYADRYL